jgi:hypothetical protein
MLGLSYVLQLTPAVITPLAPTRTARHRDGRQYSTLNTCKELLQMSTRFLFIAVAVAFAGIDPEHEVIESNETATR